MQIPLIIAYCPESSVYRRWHPEQGGVSPFWKEVRASQTLTKVLGGVHHQDSEGANALHLPLSLKVLQDWAGHGTPKLGRVAILEVSPHTAAGDQVPPNPGPLKMTRNPAADQSPPTQRRMLPMMMSMERFVGMMLKS